VTPLRRALAVCLLVAALCVGAVTTVRSLHDARRTVHGVDTTARVNGRMPLFHDARDQFVDFVRGIVPAGAPVRIVQPRKNPSPVTGPTAGPPGECGNEVGKGVYFYWLLVYFLAPRPSVCDAHGSWTIYFGVPVPPGPRVHRFSATLGVAQP
jgi:hypothetical protein